MPRAFAIPLPMLLSAAIAIGGCLSAQAQHGGFHSGGGGFHAGGGSFHAGGMSSGGFASHSAPSRSFGGFSGARPAGPTHFGGPARFSSPMRFQPGRSFASSSNLRMRAPGNFSLNPGARRPQYDARRPEYPVPGHPGYDHRHHPHWPQYNYGGTTYYTGTLLPYGYPYYGYGLGYGDLDFPYDDSYDAGPGYYDQNSYYQGDSQGYDNSGAYNDGNNYVADSAPEAAEPQPSVNRRPSPNSPEAAQPSPPLPPQEAVTLVFNNGAPTQQIHNYLLSRDTLTILDGPRREIPISTLDLAATDQANRAAGVDFTLPH